jgi:putative flippase GtrA
VRRNGEITRLYRYLAAGVLNTSTAYLVFSILLFLGTHYAAATLVGGLAGTVTAYRLNSKWVFNYRGKRRYGRFLALFVVSYLVNVAIQKALLTTGLVDGYVAGAVGTVATVVLGYLLARTWVFAEVPRASSTARNSL